MRNAGQFECTEKVVVIRARTLTLVNLNEHSGLVIGVR